MSDKRLLGTRNLSANALALSPRAAKSAASVRPDAPAVPENHLDIRKFRFSLI
jgi:hypothetical protein